LDERAALSGLTFVAPNGGTAKRPIHRYRFPPQENEFRGQEELRNTGGAKLGSVHEISIEEGWVDIKKRVDSAGVHPEAVFSHKIVDARALAASLFRLGEFVAENGMKGDGPYLAARDLLLRSPPRLGGQVIQIEGASLRSTRRCASRPS
jgi:uncharacterized protein